MKKLICALLVFNFSLFSLAQENHFSKSLIPEGKCQDLLVQVNVAIFLGYNHAKVDKNMSASEYGKYIGEYLMKSGVMGGFNDQDIIETCLLNLKCKLPENDYDIIISEPGKLEIRYCPYGGFIKNREPVLMVSCKDYMDCFNSAMCVIAKHKAFEYTSWTNGNYQYTRITKM
jgi:hypothetical protein